MDDIAVIVNALGWTLIHFLWQGMLVASLMWLLLKLIPQQRSQLRYLGGLGLYFLLLPVSINTFIFFFKSATAAPVVMSLDLPMVSVAAGVNVVGLALSCIIKKAHPNMDTFGCYNISSGVVLNYE